MQANTESTGLLNVRHGTLVASLLVLLAIVLLRTAWICDDAYITLRTVDNFVNGYGLRWNVADRVQTYTHPLWMFMLSAVYLVTREPFLSTIFLSMAVSMAAVLLLGLRIAVSRTGALLGIVILTLSMAFMDYSTSGLENPMTHLLLALFFLVYFEPEPGPKSAQPQPGSLSLWERARVRVYPSSNIYAENVDVESKDSRKLFLLSFIAALGMVNRMDAALLFLPPLAYAVFRSPSVKGLGAAALGSFPFVLWELFSLLYYGFLIPNTAYAKLWPHGHFGEAIGYGILYFRDSFQWDPVTLFAIVCGCVISFLPKEKRDVPIVIGILAYLIYIVSLGGDFMSGRFLTGPFFCAVVLIARSRTASLEFPAVTLALFALFLSLVIAPFCPLLSGSDYGAGRDQEGSFVMDERANYYRHTGLLRTGGVATSVDREMPWVKKGVEFRKKAPCVEAFPNVGVTGFFAGPDAHLVDRYGVCDPLVARLPIIWFGPVGHFIRRIPDGYLETLRSGRNVIADKDLAEYYDKLALITRGRLLDKDRLAAIWDMNTGKYDHLIK